MSQANEIQPQISSLANVVDDCQPTYSCQTKFPNLPLLAVYAGTEKLNWKELNAFDFSSLNGPRKVIIKQNEVIVNFRLLYLETNMLAKAGIVNPTQFNGKLGCSFCYKEGSSREDGRGWFYPPNEEMTLWSHFSYLNDVRNSIEANNTGK